MKVYFSSIIAANIYILMHQDTKNLSVRADDGTFGSCAVSLILRGDDRHVYILAMNQQQLRVVLSQEDCIEGSGKQTLQMQCLACRPLVEKNGRMTYQVFLP